MKLCIITRRLSMSRGGAEMVAYNLSRKFTEHGYDVHVLTAASDVSIEGVKINVFKVRNFFSPWKLLSFQRKVKKILERDQFDIVYGLCQVYPLDIYRVGGGIQRHWMKVQYSHTILRGVKYLTSLVHLAMQWLENQIFKKGNCKFFIANSRLVKNQLIEYFHISDERIKVIYNGVDTDVFNPEVKIYRESMRKKYLVDNDALVLLFVSHNWERKGLSTIIEALPKTGIEKIRLVVVGRGKKSRYISHAKDNKISPNTMIFTGPTEDVEKYYGMADIFVLPSRYEPFSNVCLEAMACGLPVITTRTNGASELITIGENGFVLDDWRASDSLAHVINILKEGKVREDIGKNAAKTAEEYTWERHVKETGKVFKTVH